jgi:hypothetical protein
LENWQKKGRAILNPAFPTVDYLSYIPQNALDKKKAI